jgi:hypothetical protein
MLVKTGAAYVNSVEVAVEATVCEPAVRDHARDAPEPSAVIHVALVCEKETTPHENCDEEPYVMETVKKAHERARENVL